VSGVGAIGARVIVTNGGRIEKVRPASLIVRLRKSGGNARADVIADRHAVDKIDIAKIDIIRIIVRHLLRSRYHRSR
jgi:hypothetical protein